MQSITSASVSAPTVQLSVADAGNNYRRSANAIRHILPFCFPFDVLESDCHYNYCLSYFCIIIVCVFYIPFNVVVPTGYKLIMQSLLTPVGAHSTIIRG
jgi:hypothetical protein